MRRVTASLVAVTLAASLALAATSTRSVPSTFGGNGRNASFVYDRELDARTSGLDALARGGFPATAPFGPLHGL